MERKQPQIVALKIIAQCPYCLRDQYKNYTIAGGAYHTKVSNIDKIIDNVFCVFCGKKFVLDMVKKQTRNKGN